MDDAQLRRLRAHNIAVFGDRLIFEAQAPITPEVAARIEAICAGPLPEGLMELWRVSFGGRVHYDLEVEFDDGELASFSFRELFYPESTDYHDLWGWISREIELAEEAACDADKAFDGKLRYLPFGGFEYLDRLYVCVEPGPDYGSVHAWMHGLPPAWVLRVNRDSIGRVADDVPGLFAMLALEQDPFAAKPDDYAAGAEMIEAIDALPPADSDLAETLRVMVRKTVADWRGAVADGTIARSPYLARQAISDAISRGDEAALRRLEALGCTLTTRLRGGGNALDHALANGQSALAEWLLARGLDARNAVRNGASSSAPDLVRKLLAAGAEPDPIAARSACFADLQESALVIAAALSAQERADLSMELLDFAAREEDSAKRIESGKMGSNEGPALYRARAERLRALSAACGRMNKERR